MAMTDTQTGRHTRSLGDEAFDRLKRDIMRCRLKPGEEISEARLTKMYGLGKAPIRRALSRLVQEGYVIAVPRHGHVIAPLTFQAIKDLFELRLLLEPVAMQKACGHIDPARLRELKARCARGYRPGDEASEAEFMAAHRGVHLEIARASGNRRLADVLLQITDEMARLLHLGFVLRERPEAMLREHASLLQALESGDAERARDISIENIHSVRALVLDGIMMHTNLSNTSIQPL